MQDDARIRTRNWIIAAAVIVVLALIVFFALKMKPTGGSQQASAQPARATPAMTMEQPLETPASAPDKPSSAVEETRRRWTARLGHEPEWPTDLNAPQDCERVDEELQRLCLYLDSRPELSKLANGYASCDLLGQAADSLAARPPSVSSELRSYEAMLSNIFHLSRVLGRKPLRLPAKLLADEQELAEPLALAVYRWMISREQCRESTRLDGDVLYAYAGFLFNTMGGQAYLRRRSPRVEGLACFYALQVVDAAQQRGYNPDGLDPRKEIGRCAGLLASQPLVFTSDYLANLDDMALRWDAETR